MLKSLIASSVLLTSVAMTNTPTQSPSMEERTITTDYFAYGNALKPKEKEALLTELSKGKASKNMKELEVESYDLITYLGGGDTSASLFSSVYVKPIEKGISLEITSGNITGISETQYTNALITSGANNIAVTVGSPVEVSGHSALVGIFKILDVDGITLDSDRMTLAQEELNTISLISSENKGQEDFNTEALNKAMIEIKQDMYDGFKNGKLVDSSKAEKELSKLIMKRLEQNGLGDVITKEQINGIIQFSKSYLQSEAVTDKDVLTQLDLLSNNVLENLKNKTDVFGNSISNKLQELTFGEKIKSFFTNLFSDISNFFSNLFNKGEKEKVPEKTDTVDETENEDKKQASPYTENVYKGAVDDTNVKRKAKNESDSYTLEEVDATEGQALKDYEVEVEEIVLTAEEQLKMAEERIAKEKEKEKADTEEAEKEVEDEEKSTNPTENKKQP